MSAVEQAIGQATKGEHGNSVAMAALVAVIYLLVELLKAVGWQRRKEREIQIEEKKAAPCAYESQDRSRFIEVRDMMRDAMHENRALGEATKEIVRSVDRFSMTVDSLLDSLKDELQTLREVINRLKDREDK